MPAPIPEEDRGVVVSFRLPKKKFRKFKEIQKEFSFRSKAKMVQWCYEIGFELLSGNQVNAIEMVLELQKRYEVEDPKQRDLLLEMQDRQRAITYTKMAEAKEEIKYHFKESLKS